MIKGKGVWVTKKDKAKLDAHSLPPKQARRYKFKREKKWHANVAALKQYQMYIMISVFIVHLEHIKNLNKINGLHQMSTEASPPGWIFN